MFVEFKAAKVFQSFRSCLSKRRQLRSDGGSLFFHIQSLQAAVVPCERSRFVSRSFKIKDTFSILFGRTVILPDVNVSNECLFVKLKGVVNYAVSFFLQKIDELCLCLDMV